MPRLNNNYLQRRQELMRLYRDRPRVLAQLSSRAQIDLHVYFQTMAELDEADLLARRRQLTADDPSLPQAGRAFAELMNPPAPPRRQRTRVTTGSRDIYVRGVRRPEPDAEKLARIFIRLADELNKQYGKENDKAA